MSDHQYPHHENDEQREDETMRDETHQDETHRDELRRDDETLHDETLHDETLDVPVADPGQPLIRYQEPQYGLSDEQVASVTAGQGGWQGSAGPTTDWSGYAGYHEEEPPSRSGFHQVAVGHLVMGIAFLGLVVIWLLRVTDAVPIEDFRWLMPLPWIAAGGLGLLALALRSGRRDEAY